MGAGFLMMCWKSQRKLLFGLSLLLLSACAGRPALQTRLTVGADTNVCNIAVLPFENWTRKLAVGSSAYRLFSAELIASKGFNVAAEGDVGLFRLRHRMLPGAMMHKDLYRSLAEQLNVDAVVLGRVVATGVDRRRGTGRVPFVELQVDLYDLRADRMLLSTVHRRWGDEYRKIMHFGLVTTTSGVMQKMSQEIIADWSNKGVMCQ